MIDKMRGNYNIYELCEALRVLCEARVARLMKQEGLRARGRRPFRPKTTQRDPRAIISPNRLAHEQRPQKPGKQLVSDITYIPTQEGWLYLAIVQDLYSRAILGWDLSDSLAAEGGGPGH